MINYNYLYRLTVITVAELNCHQLICPSSEHSLQVHINSKKGYFLGHRKYFPINALEHVVKVKIVKRHLICKAERLGYVRNPRSLMEGTETLCRDDIGDLPGSPDHL